MYCTVCSVVSASDSVQGDNVALEACYEEVERRIESAEASEYWDDELNQSRVEEWTHRYEMMDFAMESWEEACDYAINNWTDLNQHEFMEIEK